MVSLINVIDLPYYRAGITRQVIPPNSMEQFQVILSSLDHCLINKAATMILCFTF